MCNIPFNCVNDITQCMLCIFIVNRTARYASISYISSKIDSRANSRWQLLSKVLIREKIAYHALYRLIPHFLNIDAC